MHRYFNEKSHFLSLRDFLNAPCASRGGRATGVRPSISSARLRACARNAKTQVSRIPKSVWVPFCRYLDMCEEHCALRTTCYDLRASYVPGLNLATGLPARTKREGDPTGVR